MARIRWMLWCLPVALSITCFAQAQNAATDTTVEDALHRMSDQAGVVFLGEVVAIRHIAGEGGASGVVEVEFRVDQAVRGCAAGGSYVFRGRGGVWRGGVERDE